MPRQFMPDSELVAELRTHLNALVDSRANSTQFWLDCNLAGFQGEHAAIEDLHRTFDKAVIEMRTNVQVCGVQCARCNLLCIRSRHHEGDHSCNTDHSCVHKCEYCEDEIKQCGTRCVPLFPFGSTTEEKVALGILGSIRTWRVRLGSVPLFHNDLAASLPLTCAANLANCWEGKVVWKIVRKSAATTVS